jgi:hypothetical protein
MKGDNCQYASIDVSQHKESLEVELPDEADY